MRKPLGCHHDAEPKHVVPPAWEEAYGPFRTCPRRALLDNPELAAPIKLYRLVKMGLSVDAAGASVCAIDALEVVDAGVSWASARERKETNA